MKNLILTFAILTTVFSANAFVNNNSEIETINTSAIEDFVEVTLNKLPETVAYAVIKDYANATLIKAYINNKEQYKLELQIDKNVNIIYADNEGNWLEETEITNNN